MNAQHREAKAVLEEVYSPQPNEEEADKLPLAFADHAIISSTMAVCLCLLGAAAVVLGSCAWRYFA